MWFQGTHTHIPLYSWVYFWSLRVVTCRAYSMHPFIFSSTHTEPLYLFVFMSFSVCALILNVWDCTPLMLLSFHHSLSLFRAILIPFHKFLFYHISLWYLVLYICLWNCLFLLPLHSFSSRLFDSSITLFNLCFVLHRSLFIWCFHVYFCYFLISSVGLIIITLLEQRKALFSYRF